MNREQMIDRMIRSLGFEDERVIEFCTLCEFEDDCVVEEYFNNCMKNA